MKFPGDARGVGRSPGRDGGDAGCGCRADKARFTGRGRGEDAKGPVAYPARRGEDKAREVGAGAGADGVNGERRTANSE